MAVMKDKHSFPARLAGWEYQYERAEKLLGLLTRAYRMLERCGSELPSIFEMHDRELMNDLDKVDGLD